MNLLDSVRRMRRKAPAGFRFSRPLVLLQSDDWGRVGVRDTEGREELRAAGIELGEKPYDWYSLETAEDVGALADVLRSVRDAAGNPACLGMNFVTANVDFAASAACEFREIKLKPLADGLPGRWSRPGLASAYRSGIDAGVFAPALHGVTHFCQQAVLRALRSEGPQGELLRKLWQNDTPYIYWRMPWVGYEYWDLEQRPSERFLSFELQQRWIEYAAQSFRAFFGVGPRSACAPGYRADAATHRAWTEQGIRFAQNGPGQVAGPYFDEQEILHSYRSLDFEPALNPGIGWEECCVQAEQWLARGLPFVISTHSINIHSTLARFRERTLPLLGNLLRGLQHRFSNLLFVNDAQLLQIVETGSYEGAGGRVEVAVKREGREAK